MLEALYRGVLGLFVDDRALAVWTIAVIALAGVVADLMPAVPLQAGAVLLFGCLGVLVASVLRAAKPN
jgi:hypothetical protein